MHNQHVILLFFYLFVHVVFKRRLLLVSLQFKDYSTYSSLHASSARAVPSVLQTLAHKNDFPSHARRLDRRKASRVVVVGETRDEEALFGAS